MVSSDPAKSGLEEVHGWMDKNISITKNKSLLFFFRAVYHSKNHVIPHPAIAANLDVILNILQR